MAGARYLVASTDDVLGLGLDARVREAGATALKRLGPGAAPPGLVAELETRLAGLTGAPTVRVGADPTRVLLTLLEEPARRLVGRRSLVDVPGLSPRVERFADAPGLETALALPSADDTLVAVDASPFVDGALEHLPRLLRAAQQHGARLLVRDTLGVGALGASGGGVLEHLGLRDFPGVVVASLHALGADAVVAAGPTERLEALGPLAPPPAAQAAALNRALDLLAAEPHRRERLLDVAERLGAGLRALGFDTGPSVTHRLPVWLGPEALLERWLSALAEAQVACRGMALPERSRLVLSPPATLTDEQIDQLLDVMGRLKRKLGAPEPLASHVPPVLARPGTFSVEAKCDARWFDQTPARVRATGGAPAAKPDAPASRLRELVETVTWRALNVPKGPLSRLLTASSVRVLLGRGPRR